MRKTKNGDILLETITGTGEAVKLKIAIVEAGESLAKVLSKETRRYSDSGETKNEPRKNSVCTGAHE